MTEARNLMISNPIDERSVARDDQSGKESWYQNKKPQITEAYNIY
jgi:hypothetical protein